MASRLEKTIRFAEDAARDGFKVIRLRTEFMTPAEAAEVMQHLPAADGFDPAKIATHLKRLPAGTGESVQLGRSASQAFVAVSIPRDPRQAFEWADELLTATSASGAKMNFGPGKATDIKVFWGKPEVNTLIEIGGDE